MRYLNLRKSAASIAVALGHLALSFIHPVLAETAAFSAGMNTLKNCSNCSVTTEGAGSAMAMPSVPAKRISPTLLWDSANLLTIHSAISSDGSVIADETGGVISLRDGESGKLIRRWRAYEEQQFSGWMCLPKGKEQLAVFDGHRVSIWDTATGNLNNSFVPDPLVLSASCVDGLGIIEISREMKSDSLSFRISWPEHSAYSMVAEALPSLSKRQAKLIPVTGGDFVGVGQYIVPDTLKEQPWVTITLLDPVRKTILWTSRDIPTFVGLNNSTVAISPDGRFLAYVHQNNSAGDTLSSVHVKGQIVLVEGKSGKFFLGDALKGLSAESVAFVNNGKWLMLWGRHPDQTSFIDLQTGKKIRSVAGHVEGIFPKTATRIIVNRTDEPGSRFIDLPSLEQSGRIGRQTEMLEGLFVADGRMLVSSIHFLKEIPVLVPTHGMHLKSASPFFSFDKKSGRVAYVSAIKNVSGLKVETFRLRRLDGTEVPIILPKGEIVAGLAYVPGKELIVVSIRIADSKRLDELTAFDLEHISSNGNKSFEFQRNIQTKIYQVGDDGLAHLLGERKGLPSGLQVTPDGSHLWLSLASDIVELRLPSLEEENRQHFGFAPDGFQISDDGEAMLVNSSDSLSVVTRESSASYASEAITTSIFGQGGQILFAEGQRLKRWWSARTTQKLPPIPYGAVLAENLSRYVSRNGDIVDLHSGVRNSVTEPHCKSTAAISPNGKFILCKLSGNKVLPAKMSVIEADSGVVVRSFEHFGGDSAFAFSSDSRTVFYRLKREEPSSESTVWHTFISFEALDIESGNSSEIFRESENSALWIDSIATSGDGAVLAVAAQNFYIKKAAPPKNGGEYYLNIYRKGGGKYQPALSVNRHGSSVASVDVSPAGDRVALNENGFISVFDTATGHPLWRILSQASDLVRFAQDGSTVSGLTNNFKHAYVYEAESGKVVRDHHMPRLDIDDLQATQLRYFLTRSGLIEMHQSYSYIRPVITDPDVSTNQTLFVDDADITNIVQLSPQLLALLRIDGCITLFNIDNENVIGRIVVMTSGNWVFITPDGRFDTSSLEDIGALHWVLADEPYRPLPLELFMRAYYEPGLLQKIVQKAHLPRLPELSALNRAQPVVVVEKIEAAADAAMVNVTLNLTEGDYSGVKNGAFISETSGIKYIRLFRNGKLVGSSDDISDKSRKSNGSYELIFNGIRLPKGESGKNVEFSAYAFNQDGVKGPTHAKSYSARHPPTANRRALILAIGVNEYENPSLQLDFAANDARSFIESLTPRLKASRRFDGVLSHLLVSDDKFPHAARKAAVRNLFLQLAGQGGGNAKELPVLTPDDILIFFFSGHGALDESGNFYLLPHDVGISTGSASMEDMLKHSISSDELATWLKDIDVGEIVLVIDACHSAGAIGDGYKPGPSASKGLGQLAYDRGIRILAATQADDVAIEVSNLKHGILTYVLLSEGLDDGKADFRPRDGKIQFGEWLQFAPEAVPQLVTRIVAELAESRGLSTRARGPDSSWWVTQQPSLFDFRRGRIGKEPTLQ